MEKQIEEYLSIGKKLFHKYWGFVTVVKILENSIVGNSARGIYNFAFYEFGKVLYFHKAHSGQLFETLEEYLAFCKEEESLSGERRIDFTPLFTQRPTEIRDLLKIKKEQESVIKDIIKKRKIKHLVHFTRVENLASILENGLIPVGLQKKSGIVSLHNDEQRFDAKLDCTSFSVEFPNYKLFYAFRESKFPGTKWVTIVLNTNILFLPYNITYFCCTNAASVLPNISSPKELCTARSFENMFCEYVLTKGNKNIYREQLNIKDCWTTDPQAEILISDIIGPRGIKYICFQSNSDAVEYAKKNDHNLLNKYECRVFPDFFNSRKDFAFWKKE